MGLQKDHDLPDDLLLGPGPGDPVLALRTDALKLRQPLGLALDYVEDRSSEGLDQFFGKVRADTLDHPRSEVLLNALDGTRRDHPQLMCPELQAVVSVVRPLPLALDKLPSTYSRRGTDDCHQLPLPSCLDP